MIKHFKLNFCGRMYITLHTRLTRKFSLINTEYCENI